jgi:lipoprotein-anchoring transpeptidase ErfK/SrfK
MGENMTENTGGNKKKKGFYFVIAGGVVVGIVAIYLCVGLYYSKHIFNNVLINGINVSGMTLEAVREDLSSLADNYTLVIKERNDKEESIDGKDIDLKFSYDDSLEEILESQRIWEWGVHLFKTVENSIELIAEYDSEKLDSLISNLECMDTDNMESPTDAYMEYDEEKGLELIPENLGTKINKKDMLSVIKTAIESAQTEINLDEAGAYVAPKVTIDDEGLINRYNILTKYLDMVITYHFDDEVEVLDRSVFYDWISQKQDGSVDFDQDMIKDYVKSLASRHNTAYRKHELETSYGQTVTISNGSYGWIIDQATEREELYEALMAGESMDREPVYSQTAASHTGNDYGDTYVEINLSAQHLFFYVDGELLVESDFVSGNESRGWSTPGGIFPLTYKERNATLRGTNYATPVNYWMPFNGNIGMHDSNWRSSYGKNIYKTNGSHGCINLPPSVAEVIFDNIEKGMPVLCYYLSSTEYKSGKTEEATVTEEEPVAEEEPAITVDNTTPVEETPVENTPIEETPVDVNPDTTQLQ